MKKQATTTPATPATTTPATKNFCAQISTELAAQIDNLAAKNKLQNKPETLAFLHSQYNALAQKIENLQKEIDTLQIEKAAAPVLRCENFPYLLECYITAALAQNEPITKQAAQNYIALKTGVMNRKINVVTIENTLSYYISEILAHAQKHGYNTDAKGVPIIRFSALIQSLEDAKKRREIAAEKAAEKE
jgi:hypothetical protein